MTDAKQQEVAQREKHSLNGVYTVREKGLRELEKQKHIQDNQNEYQKLDISG